MSSGNPGHVDHASAVKKCDHQSFVAGFALSRLLGSGRASMLPLETLSLGLGTNITHIFRIFSSSRIIVCTVPKLALNCAFIVFIDTLRFLSMKFFIWPIKSGVLTSLLLPHLSSSLTDSLPPLNLFCHSKTDARFLQDGQKAV